METDTLELLPTPTEPSTLHIQDDFSPKLDLANDIPIWLREDPIRPVQLETTGVTPQFRPQELFSKVLTFKESIVAKLLAIGADNLAEPLKNCHTTQAFAQCTGCRKVRIFWNRCENFYCPSCQPMLAHERTKSIQWWANEIGDPKHVVLTARNTKDITFERVTRFKHAITRLRRRRICRAWRGGCWSLEVTNEGQGWHLHAHLLVDVGWIDPRRLAVEWAKIIGQDCAIVKVKAVLNREYLAEITKYAVKGSQLAKWNGFDIATFINAFSGQRTFGVFGSLYGKRTKFAEWIKSITGGARKCECGCAQWRVFDANEWEWHCANSGPTLNTKPIPPPIVQPEFTGV